MKFIAFYFTVSLTIVASFSLAKVVQKQIKPQPNQTENLAFTPAANVLIGPVNILSAYSEEGVDFVLNHRDCHAIVSTDNGRKIYPAEVFMLTPNTWTAVMGNGNFITIYAETGITEMRIDAPVKTFKPEVWKP